MSNLATARKFAETGARYAMSAAQNANVQGTAAHLIKRMDPLLYKAQVVREIAKHVYKTEKLAPPTMESLAEAQSVATRLYEAVRQGAFKQWSSKDIAKGAVLASEAFTFFLLGEIVGRRNLIGYEN